MNDLFRLDDKVAIVTGGAGLLGTQFCKTLARAGASVVVADLREEEARTTAAGLPGRNLPVATDVSDPDSVAGLIDEVLKRYDRIDILVNNAAINPHFDSDCSKEHVHHFESFPLELWKRSLSVDLTGMFLCSRAVASPMLQQNSGVLINICSTYGLVGPDQRLYRIEEEPSDSQRSVKPVSYSVTKSAVLGLTRYLATYYRDRNIRVNALTPGGVRNGQSAGFLDQYGWRTPMGRMAEPNEYNGALLFLASEASSYMTGSNLVVDGGWTAW